jgi:hypothetical protein
MRLREAMLLQAVNQNDTPSCKRLLAGIVRQAKGRLHNQTCKQGIYEIRNQQESDDNSEAI